MPRGAWKNWRVATCGQLSAWLVFAMLGLYPAQPASGQHVLGVPLLRQASPSLKGGATLDIHHARVGARLNGRSVLRTALPHEPLVGGGRLEIGQSRVASP
jgi:putative alpha-1,2-mannosidase